MKLTIETRKPVEIKEGLDHLVTGLQEQGKGQITASYKVIQMTETHGLFECEFSYLAENRASNWIVKRQFNDTLHKIDKDVKLK